MPPKQKITKEMMLQTAKELVRSNGIESVNSRNVANVLGCSTQPVFSQFQSMEELRQGVHDYCCSLFEQEVLQNKEKLDFIKESYLKVIHLAIEEKNIFRLIYLSEYCNGSEFITARLNFESNHRILLQLMEQYELSEEDGKDILQRTSLLVHGIATLLATTNINYSDEVICNLVDKTILDMVNGVKSDSNDMNQPHKTASRGPTGRRKDKNL